MRYATDVAMDMPFFGRDSVDLDGVTLRLQSIEVIHEAEQGRGQRGIFHRASLAHA